LFSRGYNVRNQKAAAVAPVAALAVGGAFDRESISVALVDETGRIIAERKTGMPTRTTRAALGEIRSSILEVATSEARGAGLIKGIGISADGIVDPSTGRVTLEGMKGWTRVDVTGVLEELLAEAGHDIRTPSHQKRARAELKTSAHPPITVYPRLAAMAAGEAWRGAARGKANAVYLSLDETVSAGILADGRPLRGATGEAGAVGWMSLLPEYKSEYELNGCLAAEIGPRAFARRAIEDWRGTVDSMLAGLIKTDPTVVDAGLIVKAAQGNDDLARQVMLEIARAIGRGTANLLSLLNPEAVILGGSVAELMKPWLDEIREEARKWALPSAARNCRIVSATLGEKAAWLGAARLSLS
jgi:glucokinase